MNIRAMMMMAQRYLAVLQVDDLCELRRQRHLPYARIGVVSAPAARRDLDADANRRSNAFFRRQGKRGLPHAGV